MLLDPERAPARLADDGSIAYFCSRGCREQYQQERLEDSIEARSNRYPGRVF